MRTGRVPTRRCGRRRGGRARHYDADSAAGSSVVTMCRHDGRFHVDHEAGMDSYPIAAEALTGGGWDRALRENREEGANHAVWIRPRLRRG